MAHAGHRGFTLVEMVISVALLGALAAMGGWMWVSGFTLMRTVNNDSAAVADGRMVVERLARELREIKLGSAGAYCISSTLPAAGATSGATTITFRRPTADGAAACGTSDVQVTAGLDTASTNLRLSYSASPAVSSALLTPYASRFELRFKDRNYADTTDLTLLRFIEISLTVQPAGARAAPTRLVVNVRNQ